MSDPFVTHSNPATQAGFTQIPNVVMLRKDLSPLAKLIYGYLKHLAWREQSDAVAPLQDVVAADLGVSDDAVRRALRDLAKAPVDEGGDDTVKLVVSKRRGQGKPNVYVLNDPGRDVESHTSKTRKSQVLKPANTRNPARARSLSGSKTKEQEKSLTTFDSFSAVPKLAQVEGRNLGFDALCEVCGIDSAGNQAGRVAQALNGGRAIKVGIRTLIWRELITDDPDDLASEDVVGETFERHVAARIKQQAALYVKKMPHAQLTPTALATWWTDLQKQEPTRYSVFDQLRELRKK